MIPAFLVAWLLPVIVARLLVALTTANIERSLAASTLRLALSMPIALGLGSITYYLWLLTIGSPGRTFIVAETISLTLLALALAVLLHARRPTTPDPPNSLRRAITQTSPPLVAAAILLTALAILALVVEYRAEPHGQWDASSIWNLRARFLFRGGNNFTDAFNPQISWSHPDYPLLLPAAVARSWLYLGRESQLAPAAISIASTLTIVALLASAVAILRDSTLGLLAALALLATDPLIRLGPAQYADIPLAALMLAATITACLALDSPTSPRGPFLLTGLLTGLACWTKNEGLLFTGCLSALLLIRACKTPRNPRIAFFFAGLLPAALLVTHFKYRFAPPNDVFNAASPADILHRLLDPHRHTHVAARFASNIITFGKGLPFILLAAAFLLGRRPKAEPSPAWLPATLAAAMTIAYYIVYVITPHDVDWHISRSATRLLLQIYPLALLAGFLTVKSPAEPVPPAAPTPSPSPAT